MSTGTHVADRPNNTESMPARLRKIGSGVLETIAAAHAAFEEGADRLVYVGSDRTYAQANKSSEQSNSN